MPTTSLSDMFLSIFSISYQMFKQTIFCTLSLPLRRGFLLSVCYTISVWWWWIRTWQLVNLNIQVLVYFLYLKSIVLFVLFFLMKIKTVFRLYGWCNVIYEKEGVRLKIVNVIFFLINFIAMPIISTLTALSVWVYLEYWYRVSEI